MARDCRRPQAPPHTDAHPAPPEKHCEESVIYGFSVRQVEASHVSLCINCLGFVCADLMSVGVASGGVGSAAADTTA